jgi:thioredoxin 1
MPTPPLSRLPGAEPTSAIPAIPAATPEVLLPGWTIPFVTASTFEQKVLRAKGPIIVEFMNPGCKICNNMKPAIEEFAAKMGAEAKVYQVNVPMESWLAGQFGIGPFPTFIMFQDGNEMGRAERPAPFFATLKAELMKPFRS